MQRPLRDSSIQPASGPQRRLCPWAEWLVCLPRDTRSLPRSARRQPRCAAIRVAAVLLFCFALAPALRSQAQGEHDDEARGLFAAGAAAFSNGRYDEASDYFQRAFEMSARPEFLYNIGQAADRARHDAVALDAFERYLAAVADIPNRGEIEGRIRVLRGALAAQAAAPAPTVAREPETAETLPTEPPDPAPVPAGAMRVPAPPPPSPAPDVGAIVLSVAGGALVVAGAILLGVGVPDLAPPRPGALFAAEQSRQQTGQTLTGVGAASLGLGVIGGVIGLVLLALPQAGSGSSAARVTASGLAVSF